MPRRTPPGDLQTISPAQARFISWVSEVLVDVVVLNLFVEFVHTVVIDSFYISILTAVTAEVDGRHGQGPRTGSLRLLCREAGESLEEQFASSPDRRSCS